MEKLKNKVALITGGTKGIGYGIAQSLLQEGVNVAITGRQQSSASESANTLNNNPNAKAKAIGLEADVRDFKSQQNAVDEVLKHFGHLDFVIANAGLGHFASIDQLSLEQWQETIDTNLTGAFYTIKASVDALKNSKGYYITISSLAGTNFFANGSAYNASKFGLTGFTQAVMLDLRQHGIKVSTIMPGSVSTYFNGRIPSDSESWKSKLKILANWWSTCSKCILEPYPVKSKSDLQYHPVNNL
jgi:3-oxoacyl-[acyl-carrier protein] reductase